MLTLLLAACIENSVNAPVKDKSLSDIEDTAAPVDTDDTDVVDDTDTDTGTVPDTDTDTGAVDTDTVDTDTGPGPDTDSGTVDTDIDTAEVDTDTWSPGPIVLDGDCGGSGYTYTSWSDSAAVEPELHVVGMYESSAGSPGPAYVFVERGSEMILALTSYSAVDWEVELDAGSNVTEILVSSYDVSSVTFTTAVTAPVVYGGWVGACGYEYPDMDPTSGCETPDLEALLEAGLARDMSSFQGCYSGGTFHVD